jgi:hypothetical protein
VEIAASEFVALTNEACELLGSKLYFDEEEKDGHH